MDWKDQSSVLFLEILRKKLYRVRFLILDKLGFLFMKIIDDRVNINNLKYDTH